MSPRRRAPPKKIGSMLEHARRIIELDEQGELRLDEAEVKKFMRLSRKELAILNAIAEGRAPRNSQAILAAIRLKLEMTIAPAAPKGAGTGAVTVVVKTLGDKPEVTPALPPADREPQDEAGDDEEIH